MELLTLLVLGVLLVVYLVWGVVSLQLHYRYHRDLSITTEAVTLGGVAVFYALATAKIQLYLGQEPLWWLFAMLGLLVSGTALYGPMIVSLLSQLMVDMVTSRDTAEVNVPRFGPAEALERQGDYEGAAQEYRVLARLFPKEPTVLVRLGNTLWRLEEFEESVRWFELALGHIENPEKALRVVNRLHTVYKDKLDEPEEASRVLWDYLERFPEAEHSESVRKRLARRQSPSSSIEPA